MDLGGRTPRPSDRVTGRPPGTRLIPTLRRQGLNRSHVPVTALAVLALTACGVSFSDAYTGTETFKGLSLSGERRVGSELTIHLQVSQVYPVPVRIACYYEDGDRLTDDQKKMAFEERATFIGDTVLQPEALGTPTKKAVSQPISFQFSVPEPGSYFLACLTPAAVENGWGLEFKISS